MMASFHFFLATTVLFAQSTVAFNCSIPPVYVDIHKRAVHDSSEFQYGSFIGVGLPAQNQSLWPSLSQNHTSFASSTYCNNSTLPDCSKHTRGDYDSTLSKSFKPNSDSQNLDKNRNETKFKGVFGKDTIHLYTHFFETDGASATNVDDGTIEVAESGTISPGIVGVGQASTLLNELYQRNLIAGRTYSLYIGQGMDRAQGAVNGSNTFGGYDRGRFSGDAHQYPMDTSKLNAMSVRVKDIVMTDDGSKTNISLFDPAQFPDMKSRPDSFQAEITTDQYPLSLPYQITQNFIKHVSAEMDNKWGDNSLRATKGYRGSLSIVLDDGFTVTLPPEVVANVSGFTPIQDRDEKDTRPFYLSTAFLGQVYLMADYDSYQFYLATAVQKNNPVMPVTFCPKATPVAYSPPKQSVWVKQGLIGALIGGILGGIGIAVTCWCFFMSWRRHRDEKRLEQQLEKGKKAKMQAFEVDEREVEFEPPPKTPKTATPFLGKWKR